MEATVIVLGIATLLECLLVIYFMRIADRRFEQQGKAIIDLYDHHINTLKLLDKVSNLRSVQSALDGIPGGPL